MNNWLGGFLPQENALAPPGVAPPYLGMIHPPGLPGQLGPANGGAAAQPFGPQEFDQRLAAYQMAADQRNADRGAR